MATPQGESSDDLTRRIVALFEDPTSAAYINLGVVSVATHAAVPVTSEETPSPGGASSAGGNDDEDGVNYTALVIGIVVGVLIIGAVVAAVVIYSRRKSKADQRRAEFQNAERSPYGDRNAPPTSQHNPVRGAFEDDDAALYGTAVQVQPSVDRNYSPPAYRAQSTASSGAQRQRIGRWPTSQTAADGRGAGL
jgi:hypothetical protein